MEQKLISFSKNKEELIAIQKEIKENGWGIISLTRNGKYYIGIMERQPPFLLSTPQNDTLYIPPTRKKFKLPRHL